MIVGTDAAPLEVVAKALPESQIAEQGHESPLPKSHLAASTTQGPATRAGSATEQSHSQQL